MDGWGRERNLGYGDHLLPPWSSQNGGLWCTLCHISTWLTRAKYGCSEKINQHPLYPSRDFPLPLSRHEHSLQGHFLCPIPTGLAVSTQATPFLWGQGGFTSWRGGHGAESLPPFPRGSVEKLRRGMLPLWPSLAVNPLIHPPSPSWTGYLNGGRIGLSPSPLLIARFQSSKDSGGMWNGSRGTVVSPKIWQ